MSTNKLILLGNGFDLAHELPTSYNDFILFYFRKRLKETLIKVNENDFKTNLYQRNFILNNGLINIEIRSIQYEQDYYTIIENITSLIETDVNSYELIELIEKNYYLSIRYPSDFFYKLIQNIKVNKWVDVEHFYYLRLKECITIKNSVYDDLLENLNKDFDLFTNHFKAYLKNITHTKNLKYKPLFTRVFNKKLSHDEFKYPIIESLEDQNSKSCFLNFNYTNTFEEYYSHKISNPHEIINIHGSLEDDIIFGFGDEHDSDYKNYETIESKYSNLIYKNIKSFKYLESEEYTKLIMFMLDGHFQVSIIGHSCGLSDRTLLKEIFNHKNCKSIIVYYYETEKNNISDYKEKLYEINRSFEDKIEFRKKIVPIDKKLHMI